MEGGPEEVGGRGGGWRVGRWTMKWGLVGGREGREQGKAQRAEVKVRSEGSLKDGEQPLCSQDEGIAILFLIWILTLNPPSSPPSLSLSPFLSHSDDPADVRHDYEWWRASGDHFKPVRGPHGWLAYSFPGVFWPDPQHSAVEVTSQRVSRMNGREMVIWHQNGQICPRPNRFLTAQSF